MEPVPVTRGVRSTVRVAVALVVGQALLCALIGWLILGRAQSDSPDSPDSPDASEGSSGVDRLALPPAGRRPTPGDEPAATGQQTVTASRQSRAVAPDGVVETAGPRRSAPAGTVPPEPQILSPQPLIAVPAIPGPSSTPTLPALSVPPTFGPAQEPVTVGALCRPVGAFGRTARQTLVRCVRDGHHHPRWKIV